jgi:hypothetical protein
MGITTKAHLPLVSATKFDVAAVSVADETDYSGISHAGSGDWVLGSSMPKGRALLMCVSTGALTGSPTGLQIGLLVGDDANGTSAAFISGTTTEVTTPAGDTQYQVEIPLSYVSDLTKYYSAGLALKGGGTTAVIAGTVTMVLDPTYK